ncbi:MAG: 2'-5' RNA ligase family protein [Candidatus Paceibacteria bacterium]
MTTYFVAHLLSGDAARYHRALTAHLSERFRIMPLHERVHPHVTIKNFNANRTQIAEVEDVLAHLTATNGPERIMFEGFGRFGFKTVYLDIPRSREALALARSCVASLNELDWMRPAHHEGEKLHASVARFLTYRKFQRVWRYIRAERPAFTDTIESLAIMKKEPTDRVWRVHREFRLEGKRPATARCRFPTALGFGN